MTQRKLIALDNGHGSKTAGKRTPMFPSGYKYAGQFMHEWTFNRAVVILLAEHLKRCGFDVLQLSPTDADTPLSTRTNIANNKIKNSFNRPADILISVHANASTGNWETANGIETLWTKRIDENLAKTIHKHLIKGTVLKDRGVKVANLHMTRESAMPACLVECAFMDNLREAELLMTQQYRAECAEEIARGVCEYFGVKFIESVIENKTSSTTVNNTYDLTKERISLVNGALKFHTLGDYSVKATDVRHIIVKKGTAKFSLAYEKGKKTSQLVTSNKADLGINCTFYSMSNGVPSGYFKDSTGKVQSQSYGKLLKWKQVNLMGDYLELSNLDTSRDNASFQFAPLIVENGVDVSAKYIKEQEVNDDIAKSACQRTFMWWDKSGNIHLAVADGRTSYDTGLTVKEMVLYSIHHGAVNTCVFDGGGSSLLATGNNGALNQLLNTGTNERTNHHALLIKFKNEAELNKDKELANQVNVVVNGKLLDTKGLLIDNLTYVPLRVIGNAIGAKIGWNQTTKEASLDGVVVEGVIIDSTTYVPLRKLGNLIGAKIGWDQTAKTASLTQ